MNGAAGAAGPAADALVECVRGAGFEGPVLLVARCDDVGRDAPAWAAACAGAGLVHRVRVASGIDPAPTRDEIDDIAAEAGNLGAAVVIVVAGVAEAGAADLAARIHAAAGRPAAVWHGARGTLSVLPDAR